jgi:hypothetical protein
MAILALQSVSSQKYSIISLFLLLIFQSARFLPQSLLQTAVDYRIDTMYFLPGLTPTQSERRNFCPHLFLSWYGFLWQVIWQGILVRAPFSKNVGSHG